MDPNQNPDPYANMVQPAQQPAQADPYAGMAQADPYASMAQPAAPPQESVSDKLLRAVNVASQVNPEFGMLVGMVKGAGDTIKGLADLSEKAHPTQTARDVHDWLQARTQAQNPNEVVGKIGESIGELAQPELWGAKAVDAIKGMSYAERLAEVAKNAKILEGNPVLARILRIGYEGTKQAAKGAALGAGQEYVKTGGDTEAAGQAAKWAGGLSFLGGAGLGTVNEVRQALANVGEEVQPTMRTIENVPFPQLATEFQGQSGESLATPRAQEALEDLGVPAELQAIRQQAFKDVQTSLAKKGIGNALQQANDAMSATSIPGVRATAPGGAWRYIPPDGRTALSGPEAQSALNQLKQLWLDTDLSPTREQQIREAYTDLRDQIDRHDSYLAAQPWQPHDVREAMHGVNSYKDAADMLTQSARGKLQLATSEGRAAYTDLINQRNAAQDAFDKNRYNPEGLRDAKQQLALANAKLEELFNQPEITGGVSPEVAAQALKEQRLANAFQELQNIMNGHFNLLSDTSKAIDRAQVTKNLGTLSSNIEDIKSRYGDVLNPVLGENGLNHIIELGDIIDNQPQGREAAQSWMKALPMTLRRHFAGIRGAVAGGGTAWLGYLLGHHVLGPVAGPAVALGTLGSEAAYRMTVERMATDPEFAQRMIYGMRNKLSPRVFASLITGTATGTNRAIVEGEQNAPSQ